MRPNHKKQTVINSYQTKHFENRFTRFIRKSCKKQNDETDKQNDRNHNKMNRGGVKINQKSFFSHKDCKQDNAKETD